VAQFIARRTVKRVISVLLSVCMSHLLPFDQSQDGGRPPSWLWSNGNKCDMQTDRRTEITRFTVRRAMNWATNYGPDLSRQSPTISCFISSVGAESGTINKSSQGNVLVTLMDFHRR